MKKLKLQIQISVDGFVARPNGELDWMTWNWDQPLKNFVNDLTDSVDTILMGRKMTDGFVWHWENIVNKPASPGSKDLSEDYVFAKKMVDYQKFIFSKTIRSHAGKNTTVLGGDLAAEVHALKSKPGKDIVAYGGAEFVSNLVAANLVDEYYLFINPTAIGEGLRIFTQTKSLNRVSSQPFECGIIVNTYKP